MPPAARPSTGSPTAAARLRTGLLLSAAAGLAVLLTWWFFVMTPVGQRLDEAAYDGSRYGRDRLVERGDAGLGELARSVLDVVSVPFLVVVIVAAGVFAVVRGRWHLAIGAGLLVGLTNITTQLLKYEVFARPDLGISEHTVNSLPSGHTTVAASVAMAALLVVPARWRGPAALLGAAYAAATGIATMAGGWHRASDVVAAVLVAAAWGALAQTLAVHWPQPVRGADPDRWSRAGARTLAVLAAVAGLLAAASMVLTHLGPGSSVRLQLIAYGGASAGVVALTCTAMLTMLLLGQERARH